MKSETTFRIGSIDLRYFRGHPFIPPPGNEREIEVPIGFWFLEQFQKEGPIEIGCVMPYYTWCRHAVYDPYDPHPMCIRKDAELCDFRNRCVLSISTIEHMGEAEYGNTNVDKEKSWRVLLRILTEASKYIVTFPVGVRRDLEQLMRKLPVAPFCMVRETPENEWHQSLLTEANRLDEYEYGSPFPQANAICILSNCLTETR